MPPEETAHMARYLFSGPDGMAVARRIDRRVDRLPGLGGLQLVEDSVRSFNGEPDAQTPLMSLAA